MAYITSYTLHQLTRNLSNSKHNISKEEFIDHVFKDPRIYDYLNKLEISYLFNFTQILKEPLEYLRQVPSRSDTGTYVRERDSKLIYHLYQDCELLNKDFVGFRIPLEVRELGLIKEFREWFEKNKFIEKYLANEIDKARIIFNYNTSFAKIYGLPLLNENYVLIDERLNSGHEHIDENFNIQQFYRDIGRWVIQADNRLPIVAWRTLGKWHSYGNKSISEISHLLDKLDINHSFRSHNSIETIREVLKEHHLAVNGLMKLLRDYFCWTYGLKVATFDVVTLENFNLKCCRQCKEVRDYDSGIKLESSQDQDNDLPF